MASGELLGEAPAVRTRRSRAAPWLAGSLVALALALALAGELMSAPRAHRSLTDVVLYDVTWAAIALSWVTVGALVASLQPRNPIGWLLLALTVYGASTGLAEAYFERYVAGEGVSQRWADAAAWFAESGSSWIPLVFVPLVFLPLYFPDGRLSGRWRLVPWCAGIGIAAFWFSEAFAAGPLYDYRELPNPYGVDSIVVDVAGLGALLVLASFVAAVTSLVVRYRRASGDERQQIKWLLFAASLAITLWLPAAAIGALWSEDVANALILAGVMGVTVAIGIAILRYRIYDIDLLINRTLVFGGLTVGVVAVYVAIVGGLSAFFHESADFWLALVATGLAALLVQPLRSELQRRVNRLTFGEPQPRSAGLRARFHEAFAPEAAELQRARRRLVAAREEERRRLRRDLHDGLGPALAGAALKVEAAENLLDSDPEAAAHLLERTRAEIQDAVADVRRLVYGLRPPALDELGLVGALEEHASRMGGVSGATRLEVEVTAESKLKGLPAAVEVAAYRIVVEAIANAARHADARTCRIRLRENGALDIEVVDDGRGLPPDVRSGVGIASMRERAEELGGICQIERAEVGGTRVHARLPLGST